MMAQPAYADTGSDIHDINYKHYAAIYLRDCLSRLPDDRKNTILQARANDPNVFLSSSWKVGIGLYLEPTDGVAGCEEGTLIQTALLSLGYADNPGKLLTDIGYTVDRTTLGCSVQNAACENGTQNRYTRPAGGDTFNSVFASRLGDVPDYARYVAYMSIFNSYCQLVEPPTGDGSAITYKKVIKNSDGNYSVEDAKAEFIIENRGGGAKFDTGKTQIKRFEYNDKDTTCRDLLTGVGSLTSDVARYNNLNKNDPITEDTTRDDEEVDCTADPTAEGCTDVVTCSIEGIGWLVCPAMIFMADITDKAYSFLASNFLSIDASTVSKTSDAWAKFRDIANILFVVALLAVVYSQITSIGITNYGIKKMLPRIIVAAVLVNLSFIICQAAVDLSNILGYGVSNLFVTIDIGGTNDEAQGWSAVIGAVLVGSAAVGIALALSVPVLLSALLAVGLIVLILVGRQALIVLLVAIAPLAFVAYLLPNTEQWFKKWAKLFSTLLLLFPIIGIVFGASRLAANIIGRVAESAGEDATMYKIIALGISTIPFFVVPGLLKGALNAAGSFGKKFEGMTDKAMGKVKSNVNDSSTLGAYKKQWDRGQQIKRNQILGGTYTGKNPLARISSRTNKGLNKSAITGMMGNRLAASGAATALKLKSEDVDNEVALMQASWAPHKELQMAKEAYATALQNDDTTKARAAQKILLGKGNAGVSSIRDVVKSVGSTSNDAVLHARSDLASAGLKGKDAALNAWSYDEGNRSLSELDNQASTYTALSDGEFATQSSDTMQRARAANGLSQDRANRILTNKDLQSDLNEDKYEVLRSAAGIPAPTGTPPPSGTSGSTP